VEDHGTNPEMQGKNGLKDEKLEHGNNKGLLLPFYGKVKV